MIELIGMALEKHRHVQTVQGGCAAKTNEA
jgi:hypothetical protein